MTLLQRSGNKLLKVIESCDEGNGRQGIVTALDAARVLASTVQVQVNMVKTMKEFLR
jgi:hypothetical protein